MWFDHVPVVLSRESSGTPGTLLPGSETRRVLLFTQLLMVLLSLPDMTLLSPQSSSLAAPSGSVSTEKPEQRMLEKRAKVVAELIQTEKDYIRDLEMCTERVMVPLQQAQVGDRGSHSQCGPSGLKGQGWSKAISSAVYNCRRSGSVVKE